MDERYKTPVILDGDPGHDDAVAWMLAKASPALEIRAVTAVAGNHTVEKMAKNPGEYHGQSAKITGTLAVIGDTAWLSVNKEQRFKVTGSPEKVREFDGKKVTVSGALQEDKENPSCKYRLQIKEIAPVESEK